MSEWGNRIGTEQKVDEYMSKCDNCIGFELMRAFFLIYPSTR